MVTLKSEYFGWLWYRSIGFKPLTFAQNSLICISSLGGEIKRKMLKNPAQNNKINSRSARHIIDLQLWILAIRRSFSCSETGDDSFGMFDVRFPGVFCFRRCLRAFRGFTTWNSSSAAILFVLSAQALLCRSTVGGGEGRKRSGGGKGVLWNGTNGPHTRMNFNNRTFYAQWKPNSLSKSPDN